MYLVDCADPCLFEGVNKPLKLTAQINELLPEIQEPRSSRALARMPSTAKWQIKIEKQCSQHRAEQPCYLHAFYLIDPTSSW